MPRLPILILAFAGCGGSGSDQQAPIVNDDTPSTLTVSGTIAGLTGSGLTLVAIGATANGGQFSVEPERPNSPIRPQLQLSNTVSRFENAPGLTKAKRLRSRLRGGV